jgi:6-phosphogluconolactonase (cycloisomerase 2 family)
MRMKCRFLSAALLLVSLGLTSCSNTSTTTGTSGLGYVWVVAQGDTSVTFYSMNLTTGQLTINSTNPAATTGSMPSAVIVAPSGKTMFVVDSANSCTGLIATLPNGTQVTGPVGCISPFTINSDGTLTAITQTTAVGLTPTSVATDPAGKFLFVANLGSQSYSVNNVPTIIPGTISVFSVQGTTLTEIAGSPFITDPDVSPSTPVATGPSGLAVTSSGNFLYVANQFTSTVSAFQYDSTSGALTALSPFSVLAGTNPSGLVLSPDSAYLYVANSGSNNISSFSTCAVVSASCGSANGLLNPVSGSPFAAGVDPVSLAITPGGAFLYAANKQSNQVTGYKVGSGTGVLTPTATASFSTGLNPTWVAIPPEGKFVYVANSGGSSVTAYGINTTNGFLGEVTGSPYSVSNTPTAIAIR